MGIIINIQSLKLIESQQGSSVGELKDSEGVQLTFPPLPLILSIKKKNLSLSKKKIKSLNDTSFLYINEISLSEWMSITIPIKTQRVRVLT